MSFSSGSPLRSEKQACCAIRGPTTIPENDDDAKHESIISSRTKVSRLYTLKYFKPYVSKYLMPSSDNRTSPAASARASVHFSTSKRCRMSKRWLAPGSPDLLWGSSPGNGVKNTFWACLFPERNQMSWILDHERTITCDISPGNALRSTDIT